MKFLSTRTHGLIDYLSVGSLIALPRALGWSDRVTNFVTGSALGALGYSLLTRYELGVLKVLPMPGHLLLDGLSGAMFCGAPFLFPDEDTTVQSMLVGIGLFEIGVALTTETEPSYGEQFSQFSNDLRGTVDSMTDVPSERTVGA
jgi:hypothetical protein